MNLPAEPTVKLTQDFHPGEKIRHKYELTEHLVIAVLPDGTLQLEGRAGLLPPTAAEPL